MAGLAVKLQISPRGHREPRLGIQLPVRIWGMNAAGYPFIQQTETLNISLHGTCLAGVKHVLLPSDILGLSYQDRKGRYRVVWVGHAGTAQSALVGLHALDLNSNIWKRDFAQVKDSSKALERRCVPRFACEGSVSLWQPGHKHPIFTTVADISERGCYVNLLTPLPVNSELSLLLNVEQTTIRVAADVRTSHRGVGMGLQFAEMEEKDRMALHNLIARLRQSASSSNGGPADASYLYDGTVRISPLR